MCTRVVYSGKNGMVVTYRSMDWKTEMHSNLWVFPKGMEREWRNGSQLPAMDVQVWQRGDFSFRDCQYRRDE